MRKSEIVRVPETAAFPRDGGKSFLVTEWPAARSEKWAIRALIACSRGGEVNIEHLIGRGMEAVFWIGIGTLLRGKFVAEEVIPILDELLECVQIVRDQSALDAEMRPVATAIVSDDDVADVPTRMWLRSEVLRVHMGFSPADALAKILSSTSTSAPASSAST